MTTTLSSKQRVTIEVALNNYLENVKGRLEEAKRLNMSENVNYWEIRVREIGEAQKALTPEYIFSGDGDYSE